MEAIFILFILPLKRIIILIEPRTVPLGFIEYNQNIMYIR